MGWKISIFKLGGAPIFVGWSMAIVVARQRLKIVWPAIGLVLVALIGCTIRVHANRMKGAGAGGQVSLGLGLGPDIGGTLVYALVILSLAVLPYLAWRLRTTYFDRA